MLEKKKKKGTSCKKEQIDCKKSLSFFSWHCSVVFQVLFFFFLHLTVMFSKILYILNIELSIKKSHILEKLSSPILSLAIKASTSDGGTSKMAYLIISTKINTQKIWRNPKTM